MGGKAPQLIVTDEDASMRAAIIAIFSKLYPQVVLVAHNEQITRENWPSSSRER
jgi:hypothetical protein